MQTRAQIRNAGINIRGLFLILMNANIKKIVEQIHPYRRMINSKGMDKAFDVVKSHLQDLKVHEYFPKESADDWEVPFGWELINAHIKKR